nr:MAG TPA: hypothetical protein [Caudoviricetes sp.]DAV32167.1 MAG TPA: hypothetical protein [Caudoviricetes sp.]
MSNKIIMNPGNLHQIIWRDSTRSNIIIEKNVGRVIL